MRTAVVAFIIAAASAFAITQLQVRADRASQAQIAVEELESDATGAAALVLVGDTYPALTVVLDSERAGNRDEIARDLDSLDRATRGSGDAKFVRDRMDAFLATSQRAAETGSVTSGLLAWRQLDAALGAVGNRAEATTRSARRQATIGMWAILLGAAAIVTLLWRRSGDARRRSDALEVEVSRDPLTRLTNHAAFHEHLASEIDAAHENDGTVSLILGDLDRFKLINDTHGHQVGDRVLVETAERLQHVSRTGDTVARIGGEEFAWILPGADIDVALASAERLRTAISVDPLSGDVGTTISVGVAVLEPTMNAEMLFDAADGALYEAKNDGRDRVGVAASPAECASLPKTTDS